MDELILDILDALRNSTLDEKELDKLVRAQSEKAHDGRRRIAKKHVLPRYLEVKARHDELWDSWNVDDALDERFVKSLQMKPRRSASGVATITVITKPWRCANNCVYCPDDPRMPKSYLSDEPACQRAERNRFDPYLQVASRLRALAHMGHATDKIELIVLGGTWLDYPDGYRTWFVHELFRALNDEDAQRESALANPETLGERNGLRCEMDDVLAQHALNERAAHRVVGLVVETRPDTINQHELACLRKLGCTKIQLGVQSIRDSVLKENGRREDAQTIQEAFRLCRLFGFKIHAHFMINLLGATPESDKRDYRTFVTDCAYMPDEVKLYPCALVETAQLVDFYQKGLWRPYSEDELLEVLGDNLERTPPFTRVSRMIRDISAKDILVGNKKTNLRQLVEARAARQEADIQEIRFREIGVEPVSIEELTLDQLMYRTLDTTEHFLQWVTPTNRIAGFLRLSLPHAKALPQEDAGQDDLPPEIGEAMIREVHVYGFATRIDGDGMSAQHHGLGRSLIRRACQIARESGYSRVNVISAVGTREYYRKLGFEDGELYQHLDLARAT